MAGHSVDSFHTRATLTTSAGQYTYFRLSQLTVDGVADIARLPFTIKIMLEGVLRRENGLTVTKDDVLKLAQYDPRRPATEEVPFLPARVLMQDFTGVPAMVDLAALRSAMQRLGHDPEYVNPLLPTDLVIDHSIQVDEYASSTALANNTRLEFERNRERYEFLRWGQQAFRNFRVVPPASGICHQVNLEYLAKVVWQETVAGERLVFPDSLVGTDSHTTMINGLGVLGWGVGGIEAEAVMLGQPYFMNLPQVIGCRLTGRLPTGVTATDAALAMTELLRRQGVVDKFIEFFGPGLSHISLADRATIANMTPETGARCLFFPVDGETLKYLRQTGRTAEEVELVDVYCRTQGLFRTDDLPEPAFHETFTFDLRALEPCVAGPRRPQDRIVIRDLKNRLRQDLRQPPEKRGFGLSDKQAATTVDYQFPDSTTGTLKHGDVVLASITSCTNTGNPWVLIAAGLLAKKACAAGLRVPVHVKTSLAPGSRVVTHYLDRTGLTPYLDQLGFHTVGYGCATCIGNSGPLPAPIASAIERSSLVTASVLSGNRNFEGRINPHIRANYLMSPPLVVAYALAGTVDIDLTTEPLGVVNGRPIYLRDLWPADEEIAALRGPAQDPATFRAVYDSLLTGNEHWNAIPSTGEPVYRWQDESTYIQEPPFFHGLSADLRPIVPILGARALLMVGDSVTTDHISPAGSIPPSTPAGKYLIEHGVPPAEFNSYGSRRGNDRVMTRGTFANIRIRNRLAPGTEGGWTTCFLDGQVKSIYDAALAYQAAHIPTLVIGGRDYGMGSSRDWAAKGTALLGIKAILAKSFETIHRGNLIGMGVLPLQFHDGEDADTLGLSGQETFDIPLDDRLKPRQNIVVTATDAHGRAKMFTMICRLDTMVAIEYYRHGGIMPLVWRQLIARPTNEL